MSNKVLAEKTLVELIPLALAGDDYAAQQIFDSVKSFIHGVAHKHSMGNTQQQEELYSAGCLGFMEALQDFDPKRNVKFITHLGWKVNGRIKNYIRGNHSLLNTMTTENFRKLFWRHASESAKLRAQGITDLDEIRAGVAQILDVPIQDVIEIEKRLNNPVRSLDARSVDDTHNAHDTLPSDCTQPDQAYESKSEVQAMRILMNQFSDNLDGTELDLWIYRVDSDDPMSLQEVGTELGVSKQYLSKVEKKLLANFKKFARARM